MSIDPEQSQEINSLREEMEWLISGVSSTHIESQLDRNSRREKGIYFSNTKWANLLLSKVKPKSWNRFIDPTCGSGDLLLAAARHLPIQANLSDTISAWENALIGYDISEDFVAHSRLRIEAFAKARHIDKEKDGKSAKQKPKRKSLRSFKQMDSILSAIPFRKGDCVLMNPPFNPALSPPTSQFFKGKTSSAAILLEKIFAELPEGGAIAAILPDSLRSGTRYKRLVNHIKEHSNNFSFVPAGRFSDAADIDIAILTAEKSAKRPQEIKAETKSSAPTVGDFFSVRVGNVVPHRDAKGKESHPFVHARSIEFWKAIAAPDETAKFKSQLFTGPLVVISRTSSPSDKKRARACVIKSGKSFLIENHLIVCIPHDRRLNTCKKLMKNLQDPNTDAWLNDRIRCRHLTVASVKEIPVWDDES